MVSGLLAGLLISEPGSVRRGAVRIIFSTHITVPLSYPPKCFRQTFEMLYE